MIPAIVVLWIQSRIEGPSSSYLQLSTKNNNNKKFKKKLQNITTNF